MSLSSSQYGSSALALDQISTKWDRVRSPNHFVDRYQAAIFSYLNALLSDEDSAEETCQEIMAQFLGSGLNMASPTRGRFRDYLKVAVRNAAVSYMRKRSQTSEQLSDVAALADPPASLADDPWIRSWRECLLNKAWGLLECYEQVHDQNYFHTVMRLSVDYPGERSDMLAVRLQEKTGTRLTAMALRQQLSRARKMFARGLIRITRESLPETANSREELIAELRELGLWIYVHRYFPDD